MLFSHIAVLKNKLGLKIILILCLLCIQLKLSGQGIYTEFGQNRIQHNQAEWHVLEKSNLSIIYYKSDSLLAKRSLIIAENALPEMEKKLFYKLSGAVQIIVFPSLNYYKQSNMGYRNPQFYSGGFNSIPTDYCTVFFNGNYDFLRIQIRKGLADIVLREMLYGGSLQDRLQNSAGLKAPLWFTSGLSSFLAQNWNENLENQLRNSFQEGNISNFNLLSNSQIDLVGHSIWKFVSDYYGAEALSNIIYYARYTHSVEEAIFIYTGMKMKDFLKTWQIHFNTIFEKDITLSLPRGKAKVPAKIADKNITQMEISPDGKWIAFVTIEFGKYKIWLYHISSAKTKLIFKGGVKIQNQFEDLSFPKIHWKHNSQSVGILHYKNNRYLLAEYNLKTSAILINRSFNQFSSVVDFVYHTDENKMAIVGIQNNQADIFILDNNNEFLQITNDLYYEKSLVWKNESTLFFISNKEKTNALVFDSIYNFSADNIFAVDIHAPKNIEQFTFNHQLERLDFLQFYNPETLTFLCDKTGLKNAYILSLNEETLSEPISLTNYRNSIIAQSIADKSNQLVEMLKLYNRNTIFVSELSTTPEKETVYPKTIYWKQKLIHKDTALLSSKNRIRQMIQLGADSILYKTKDSAAKENTYDYIFHTEFKKIDYKVINTSKKENVVSNQGRFFNTMSLDFMIWQIDNKQLGTYSYLREIPFVNMNNAFLTPILKFSVADMHRNLLMDAWARTSFFLDQRDFGFKMSFLKYKQDFFLDAFKRHRRIFTPRSVYVRIYNTQAALFTLSKPWEERLRTTISAGIRNEQLYFKITENVNRNFLNINKNFALLKLETVFDNTLAKNLNLLEGTLAKFNIDAMRDVKSKNNICNLNLEIRNYQWIKKRIIWASRLSAGYALGKQQIAYYLGGVENWIANPNKQQVADMFDLNTEDNLLKQYVGNLRGFAHGVRVGNSFLLLNNELRIPVTQMLLKKPVRKDFIQHFMATAFLDIGTAFVGKNTANPNNPFNTQIINDPVFSLTILSARNPWVFGYGFGLRTKFLGYYIKYDRAWGYLENKIQKPMNYWSLGLDF